MLHRCPARRFTVLPLLTLILALSLALAQQATAPLRRALHAEHTPNDGSTSAPPLPDPTPAELEWFDEALRDDPGYARGGRAHAELAAFNRSCTSMAPLFARSAHAVRTLERVLVLDT